MLHPLLVTIEEQGRSEHVVWACRTAVENAQLYSLLPEPIQEEHPMTPEEEIAIMSTKAENIVTWIERRGLSVVSSGCALIDPDKLRLLGVDLVAEHRCRLVLVIVYSSRRRGGKGWSNMQAYAHEVARVCRKVYALSPQVVLLNVYGQGRVQGKWMGSRVE